ncbi:MAG TPA: hypothetical protein P5511_05445, partial [Candidatus Goldiibacteriota bacterium]|nr:hypothetical protein [Candidatus Goldiibacteriota bacterium]
MKKIFVLVLSAVSVLFLALSCAKDNPAEPAGPTGTPTVSRTATCTFTITCTSTDTPPFTATPTATATATSTATPPDLYVDDFEDGDANNAINYWSANTITGTTIHYQGLIAPPPGNGLHAYAVTATAEIQAGQAMAYVNLSTGPTGSATPMNASMYNKLRFGRMFNGSLASGTKSVYVTIYDDSNMVQYQIGSVFSPGFDDWEVNLRQSY